MALSVKDFAMLKRLAAKGDIYARGILAGLDPGSVRGGGSTEGDYVFKLTDVPAKSTTVVHAAVFGDASGPVTVSTALTNPTVARNLSVTYGATWDGGDVTVTGKDQFGHTVTESFTVATGTTVNGTKIFKSVTSFAYAGGGTGTHGTNTASVGTGDKLGVSKKPTSGVGVTLLVDGAPQAVTTDTTVGAFTPAASYIPDGSRDYEFHCKV